MKQFSVRITSINCFKLKVIIIYYSIEFISNSWNLAGEFDILVAGLMTITLTAGGI